MEVELIYPVYGKIKQTSVSTFSFVIVTLSEEILTETHPLNFNFTCYLMMSKSAFQSV